LERPFMKTKKGKRKNRSMKIEDRHRILFGYEALKGKATEKGNPPSRTSGGGSVGLSSRCGKRGKERRSKMEGLEGNVRHT